MCTWELGLTIIPNLVPTVSDHPILNGSDCLEASVRHVHKNRVLTEASVHHLDNDDGISIIEE